MHCPTADSLFLRANGDFTCWDDVGSDRILLPWKAGTDMAAVYAPGGPCDKAARRLAKKLLPHPSSCPGCICLRPAGRWGFNPTTVDVMQVEPSVMCQLRCPACATPEERQARKPPRIMPRDVLEKILRDFRRAGVSIRSFDFSGHGEPLLNPQLPALIALAREMQPGSFIILRTNANGEPDPAILDDGTNQIHISIDGVDPESYAKYRAGGDFRRAWTFLDEMSRMARGRGSRTRIVWNYILFEHNSEVDQLRRAWRMAQESGVHELRFVLTHIGMWSRTITSGVELAKRLLDAEVPRRRIMVDTSRSLEERTSWKEWLKRSDMAYRTARRIWRYMARRSGNSRTVVTADYCTVDRRRIRRFLSIGLSHLQRGDREAANGMLRHAEELVRRPGKHNPRFDPAEYLGHLEAPLHELAEGLGRGRTG